MENQGGVRQKSYCEINMYRGEVDGWVQWHVMHLATNKGFLETTQH